MKDPFKKVVIPDSFGKDNDTEIRVCAPCEEVSFEHVEFHDDDNRLAYTADEARAIGQALIAAADHIQHDGQGILASEASELWKLICPKTTVNP